MRHRVRLLAALAFGLLVSTGCMTAVAAFQPEVGDVIVLATVDADGTRHERVLSPIDLDGQLYISANHWPRAWYRRTLANPDVQVTRNGQTRDYTAVPLSGVELERVKDRARFPFLVSLFTGFAPREFLRLDPR